MTKVVATKEQVVTSEETSINKTRKAAVFNILDKQNFWKENTINMDIGGGKFNNATIFLNEKGVKKVWLNGKIITPIEHDLYVENNLLKSILAQGTNEN